MIAEAIARLRSVVERFPKSPSYVVQAVDLRALLDAYDTAHARGVAEERVRVVMDLLEQAADVKWSDAARALLTSMADRYAVGEHEEGT